MFLGIGLSLRGRGAGAGGARANAGLTLKCEPIRRGVLLDASPVHSEFRRWVNDPAYADRVGYYAAGGPNSMLLQKPFADLFSFARASKAWDYDSAGLLSEHEPNTIRQGYDRATGLPAGWRLEGAATNYVPNNTGAISATSGAGTNTTALTSEMSFMPGLGVLKHTRGDPAVTIDNNVGNVSIGGPGASVTICISCYCFVPLSYAGSAVGISLDAASANIASVGYNMAAKGTWQRIHRISTTPANNNLLAAQLRPSALNGDFFYTTGWQCEVSQGGPTSLILTTGSPTVRAVDSLVVDGSKFSAIWPAAGPRTNSALWSEQLDNAAWTKTGVSVVPNVAGAAPDPSAGSADRIVEDTSNGDHRTNLTAPLVAGFNTISVYAKPETRSRLRLQWDGPVNGQNASTTVICNLTDGVTTNVGVSGSLSQPIAGAAILTNGWVRVWLTFHSPAAATGSLRVFVVDAASTGAYQGDGASSLLAWGAQVEASPAVPAPSLLSNAESFDGWSKVAAAITPNAATPLAPDGSATAEKLEEDATNAGHYITQSFPAVSGQPYVFCVRARAAERSAIQFILTSIGPATTHLYANFDLTGMVASSSSGSTATVTDAGNGWRLCTLVVTSASQTFTSIAQIRTMAAYSGSMSAASHQGVAGSGVHLWGAQLVQATVAPAYVPMSALVGPYVGPVTSAPLTKHIATAKEGFIICDVSTIQPSSNYFPRVAEISDGTLANRITLSLNGSVNRWEISTGVANVSTSGISASAVVHGSPFRIGLKWGSFGLALCVDGGAPVSLAAPIPPFLDRLHLGNRYDMQRPLNGRMRAVFAGSVVPSDAKFQQMCQPGANIDAALAA